MVRAQEVRVGCQPECVMRCRADQGQLGKPSRRWGVIPVYTAGMKTAISLPDETFDRVSRRASDLGMSRSEFFTRAAQRYLDELDAQSLTGQIDRALETLDGADEAEAAAVAIGNRVLEAVDDEW
jgi:predicted DNA-binding protein